MEEYHNRTIQINDIIHLNMGINVTFILKIQLFGSSLCICKVFKYITAKDDEAKACVLFVLSCLVKRSSKLDIALGFLHQLNRQYLVCNHRQQM